MLPADPDAGVQSLGCNLGSKSARLCRLTSKIGQKGIMQIIPLYMILTDQRGGRLLLPVRRVPAVLMFCSIPASVSDDCICRRYNPKSGELTLTCEKYPDREQNRRELLDTVHALIAEGHRMHPQTDPAIIEQQKERKAARQNVPPMAIPEYNPLKKVQQQ